MNNAPAIASKLMAPAHTALGWLERFRHSRLRKRQMRSLAFAIRSGVFA
ncbi:MAG TPA: hypothetical protein VMU19_11040 [Bryobacteraceae bacterium]|nr:hypothetical protein [Bryobacteraceae bacterium]